jgi:6,7-dimethyl-8-ribityllumazine synthase
MKKGAFMSIVADQDETATCPIAIVVSRFNEEITSLLLQGALQRLRERRVEESCITLVHVPGAVEIPVTAQQLANCGHYEAIICLGAVIRGETDHYEYVCHQVSDGCQRVALDHRLPVIFGVLTTDTVEQALARAGGSHGHKGREAVDAALAMVAIMHQLHERA